jgi:hypothetical protein
MTPNQQRVFDAQMAVGDPQKHPEFAGNVISIDTRPMCRPLAESPGGRDRYSGNAASRTSKSAQAMEPNGHAQT